MGEAGAEPRGESSGRRSPLSADRVVDGLVRGEKTLWTRWRASEIHEPVFEARLQLGKVAHDARRIIPKFSRDDSTNATDFLEGWLRLHRVDFRSAIPAE